MSAGAEAIDPEFENPDGKAGHCNLESRMVCFNCLECLVDGHWSLLHCTVLPSMPACVLQNSATLYGRCGSTNYMLTLVLGLAMPSLLVHRGCSNERFPSAERGSFSRVFLVGFFSPDCGQVQAVVASSLEPRLCWKAVEVLVLAPTTCSRGQAVHSLSHHGLRCELRN